MTPDSNVLQKLQLRKELLVILLFLFVIVVFWVGLSLFASQHTTGITKEQQTEARALSPTINDAVLDALESKRMYDSEELSDFPIFTEVAASTGPVVEGEALGTDTVVLPSELENQIQTLEENL